MKKYFLLFFVVSSMSSLAKVEIEKENFFEDGTTIKIESKYNYNNFKGYTNKELIRTLSLIESDEINRNIFSKFEDIPFSIYETNNSVIPYFSFDKYKQNLISKRFGITFIRSVDELYYGANIEYSKYDNADKTKLKNDLPFASTIINEKIKEELIKAEKEKEKENNKEKDENNKPTLNTLLSVPTNIEESKNTTDNLVINNSKLEVTGIIGYKKDTASVMLTPTFIKDFSRNENYVGGNLKYKQNLSIGDIEGIYSVVNANGIISLKSPEIKGGIRSSKFKIHCGVGYENKIEIADDVYIKPKIEPYLEHIFIDTFDGISNRLDIGIEAGATLETNLLDFSIVNNIRKVNNDYHNNFGASIKIKF